MLGTWYGPVGTQWKFSLILRTQNGSLKDLEKNPGLITSMAIHYGEQTASTLRDRLFVREAYLLWKCFTAIESKVFSLHLMFKKMFG